MSERDWNGRYLEGHTPWDKGFGAPPLEELLESEEASTWLGEGAILVPGCGRGHDVRVLARATEGQAVIGIDLAGKAIEEARERQLGRQDSYLVADWFEYTASGPVSLIWEHTCYCAIDPGQRQAYAARVRALLKPGGHFFGVFFLKTGSDEGPPWPSTEEELLERFGQGFALVHRERPTRQYESRRGREIVLGWRRE